jgi:hypothetical protein
MSRVNSQRENEPKERESAVKSANGGQQLRAEKVFFLKGL